MNLPRLGLAGIRVEGPGVPPAAVDFAAGLTVITGASDTGKTYIANTVDYLLGATAPPPDNPVSRKYTRAFLGLIAGEARLTLGREFRDNAVQVYDQPVDSVGPETPKRQLAASQRGNPSESLSQFLLSLLGLQGKQLRKNQYGEKAGLSLRHIAHLTVISEERIISKLSPALSGDLVSAPLERSIFSFFLTGIDDADLSATEKPKDRKARLDAEEGFVQSLLQAKEAALQKLIGDEKDVARRLNKIDQSIDEATRFVTATHEQIQELENIRETSWQELQKRRSRQLFVSEQLKRLDLLDRFYLTDRQRLESVIEAGRAFELLPGGECAVCGSRPEASPTASAVDDFRNACTRELEKLQQLAAELRRAISDMQQENSALGQETQRLERVLAEAEQKLQGILHPQSSRADRGLVELIRLKTQVSKAVDLQSEIAEINERLKNIAATRKRKPPKPSSSSAIGTARAARFCAVVQEILSAWKYPLSGNVAFDPDAKKFDIVIGDQDRGSMGKGYRAITHAAFVIGLMKYCRRENIPHPGFVLLDTPLNPFKGPDEGPEGRVNDEIKNAFFEDLAKDRSGDQFIILENTEPPQHLIPLIRYHHFSKNPASGRYGFFPLPSS